MKIQERISREPVINYVVFNWGIIFNIKAFGVPAPRCSQPQVDSNFFPPKHGSGNCSVLNLIYENFKINFRARTWTKIFRQIVCSPKNAGRLKLFGSLDWIQQIVSAKPSGGGKWNSENAKHFVPTLSKLQNSSFIFFFLVKALGKVGSTMKKEEKRVTHHKKNLECVTLGSFSVWPFPVCARKPPNENELYHRG